MLRTLAQKGRYLMYTHLLRRRVEMGLRNRIAKLVPGQEPVIDHALSRGHRSRSVGCLVASMAVGGTWRDALPLAIAIEMSHKSSVIRDDIADSETYRAGRLTTHALYGIPKALAASDVLLATALKDTLAIAGEQRCRFTRRFIDVYHTMSIGQFRDVDSPSKTTYAATIHINHQKSGILAGLALAAGATAGGGSPDDIQDLELFGRKVGTAFQLLNDVHSFRTANESRTDKVNTDLRLKRRTPVIILALDLLPRQQRERLKRFLDDPLPATKRELEWIENVIGASSVITRIEREALAMLGSAHERLSSHPPLFAIKFLRWVCQRDNFSRLVF